MSYNSEEAEIWKKQNIKKVEEKIKRGKGLNLVVLRLLWI